MHDELALTISPLEDHLAAPRGRARLRGSELAGSAGGAACGDEIRIALELSDDGERVLDAGFDAGGCAAARAAGSAVVELVRGRSFVDAARIGAAAGSHALGGLSPQRGPAAGLAAHPPHP